MSPVSRFWKSGKKILILLKLDKIIGHFVWGYTYICIVTALSDALFLDKQQGEPIVAFSWKELAGLFYWQNHVQ